MRRTPLTFGLLILMLVTLVPFQTIATVKLPKLVSSGMVLQRDVPLKIWGWADTSEKISLRFLDQTYKTKADKNGNWSIELPAMNPGGPYEMTINDIQLKDILIGDVWLASGQSNMELWLGRVTDLYAEEIAAINNTNIRLFRSSTRENAEEERSDYPDGQWLPATQENIMRFSAVAWFFAEEIHKTEQVPIGIISTAIGGSPAEAWLSKNKVDPFLSSWLTKQAKIDSVRNEYELKHGKIEPFNWSKELNKIDAGVNRWSKEDVDLSDWDSISVPGYWVDKGVDLKKGSIWFCKEFDVPDSLAAKSAVLRLGRIIDSDSAFINGTFVGSVSYQYPPRIYKVPEDVLKPGKNKLMVRVFSQGNRGGFVEEKPYELRFNNLIIDITGDWCYKIGASLNPPKGFGNLSFRPGGLYNSLINPVKNYATKGVIWYQGETNAGRGYEYRQLFKDLILDWRTQLLQPDLPFLFVQLANLGVPNKQPVENGWAELRDAQRRALELANTGMAVAFDLGEWNDIHPLNKKDVAHRLVLEAQRVAYGNTQEVSSGPLYQSMKKDNKAILLTFKSVGTGLFTNCLLEGFQIAGPNKKFVWAKAVVMNKNTIKVWSKKIINPSYVRYAWDGNPAGANLKNKEGLPASPFTTEQ